jgi:hypothetical protein
MASRDLLLRRYPPPKHRAIPSVVVNNKCLGTLSSSLPCNCDGLVGKVLAGVVGAGEG